MAGDTATTRRTRRSTSAVDKDNATVDLGAGPTLAENRKKAKSRSKSMGPGGLDVLKAGSGNRRVVALPFLFLVLMLTISDATTVPGRALATPTSIDPQANHAPSRDTILQIQTIAVE